MRELAVQSASDGVHAADRANIDLEFQQLKAEITRIGDGTEYNNMKMIDGSRAKSIQMASGAVDPTANTAAADTIPIRPDQFLSLASPLMPDPGSDPNRYIASAGSLPDWLVENWSSRYDFEDLLRIEANHLNR